MCADKHQGLTWRGSEGDVMQTAEEETGRKGRTQFRGTRDQTRGGVASMSAERLARKRATDREAQRMIRQRQKNYITSLEERIRELSNRQHSDQSLEEEQRKNTELEAELRLLREQLYGPEDGTSALRFMSSASGYVSDALGEPNTVSYRTPLDSQYGYVGPAGSAPILVPPETANADNLWSSQVSDTFVAEPEPGYDPYIVGNPSRNFFNPDFGTMDNPDAAGYFNPPPGADDGSFYTHSTIDLYGNSSSNVRRSRTIWRPIAPRDRSSATTEITASLRSFPTTTRLEPQTRWIPSSFVNQPSLHVWELPLRFAPPKGRLENILINVIQHQRSLAVRGTLSRPHWTFSIKPQTPPASGPP